MSDEDHDEMENNPNSTAKGSGAKNRTKSDDESNIKVPGSVDRNTCRSKINHSMERRTLTMENVYDCKNDHQCEPHQKQINAVEYVSESEEEQHILICVIDLVIENESINHSSLITSDESMIISPDTTIDESWSDRKNKTKDRRRGRKLCPADYSTPKWKSLNEGSSLLTSDMSEVTEISTHDEPAGLSFWEKSHNE